MNTHKIQIEWNSKSVTEVCSILNEGLSQKNKELSENITFTISQMDSSFDSLSLDPGIVIAIINSSVALAVALISTISQIIISNKKAKTQQIEVGLHDGTKIVVPLNANAKDIKNVINGLHEVRTSDIKKMIIS